MSKTYRNKSLIYKRCNLVNAHGFLANYIAEAIDQVKPPAARLESVGTDGTHRFINTFKLLDTMWVGNLFEFTHGSLPSGFRMDESAPELPVEALVQLDEGRHFIESALYFGVMGNHVVLMPSGALRAADLQNHLNWLLHTRAQVLPQDAAAILMDEPAPEMRDHWHDVKAITFRSPLTPAMLESSEEKPNGRVGAAVTAAVIGLFRNPEELLGRLRASDVRSVERLAVTLEVRYSGRVENIDTQLLDHLAAVLPDEEAQNYEFDIRGIGRVKGGQVKLARKKSIAYVEGLPVLVSVAEGMHEWLYRLLEQARIRE